MDCWSAGIVLYMLLTGQHPFDTMGENKNQDYTRLQNGELFLYIMDLEAHVQLKMKENVFLSRQAKDLVCKLIVTDPEKRLSAK